MTYESRSGDVIQRNGDFSLIWIASGWTSRLLEQISEGTTGDWLARAQGVEYHAIDD